MESNERCNLAMWDEKYYPGVKPDTLAPNDGFTTSHVGHYYNLRGGTTANAYNRFDRVACGFYVNGNNQVWINMNFGAPQGAKSFLCGGVEGTHPNGFVHDCTVTGNYGDCTDTNINYHVPGCQWTHDCYHRMTNTGPCEDRTDSWNNGQKSCADYPGDGGCFLAPHTLEWCPRSCDSCPCQSLPDHTLTCLDCPDVSCDGTCASGEHCIITDE